MEVTCSKGTYIRTLCHDIGEKLGCGGCMESLIRTGVGRFVIQDSLSLSEIEQIRNADRLEEILIPIDAMFIQYPKIVVKKEWESLAKNGNALPKKAVTYDQNYDIIEQMSPSSGEASYVRLYNEADEFIAIYSKREKEYHIVKMFYTNI